MADFFSAGRVWLRAGRLGGYVPHEAARGAHACNVKKAVPKTTLDISTPLASGVVPVQTGDLRGGGGARAAARGRRTPLGNGLASGTDGADGTAVVLPECMKVVGMEEHRSGGESRREWRRRW